MTITTNKHLMLVCACLVVVVSAAGCGEVGMAGTMPELPERATATVSPVDAQASPGIETTRPASAVALSDLVAMIRAKPADYTGKQVEIVGYYRGWDLLQETHSMPPVTRSDWVIADRSGAIYVTGAAPQGLDPASKEDTNKVVRLVATVAQNENGVYLHGISVETISIP